MLGGATASPLPVIRQQTEEHLVLAKSPGGGESFFLKPVEIGRRRATYVWPR
ncbi:hypothetical protein X768_32930 [Mesorhizobium sp. LSJC265A00]|nr:hypothetical protein X768_32930 [Mesorhizobium sp. LSJC265A00]ESY00642.1 hypothetical protein X753_29730 [Mesorhizobium sp. LNJC399B00]